MRWRPRDSNHLRASKILIVWLNFKDISIKIDFDARQRLEIVEATIELTDSLRGLSVVQKRPRGGKRVGESTMIFYKKDMQLLPSDHNCHFI